jgi:hypothetical protein
MTLPIDAVAVGTAGSALVGSMATGTAMADSAAVGATISLVVVDPAQAVNVTKPVRLRRKMTFRIKLFMDASPSW